MENFKVIIVEDVALELKGTEGIFRNDIPEAEIIGTADSETAYWRLMKQTWCCSTLALEAQPPWVWRFAGRQRRCILQSRY